MARVLTALLIACLAVEVDGLVDYGDRPARCDSLAVFDVGEEDLSSMCEGFVNDGFRGFVFLLAAVPVLFWAGVFWALWATRDPYRQRLTRSR